MAAVIAALRSTPRHRLTPAGAHHFGGVLGKIFSLSGRFVLREVIVRQ